MDDIKYSRQRYVLGAGAMHKLAHSSVYLCGFGALGVEIAKNLILTGVEKLTIHDCKIASAVDLNFNFFLDRLAVDKENRVIGSLKQLREMNPSVEIEIISSEMDDLFFLTKFQCVVLTETPFSRQIVINEFCRLQNPPIKFIAADCPGIFCSCFCDFGDQHEVYDVDGEESKDLFIAELNKNEQIVTVALVENERHQLEVGDWIIFGDIQDVECLNGHVYTVISTTFESFQIAHDHADCPLKSFNGGICRKVKKPVKVSCESLSKQLYNPTFIEGRDSIEVTYTCHLALLTLHQYVQNFYTFPKPWCDVDLQAFNKVAQDIVGLLNCQIHFSTELLNMIGATAAGVLPPLSAFMGGVVAQEVLKGITNKFIPIRQWFYFNAADIVKDIASFNRHNDPCDVVSVCLSDQLSESLKSLRVFLVGCGAIGCEILKNLALLNVGASNEVTVTDNDLVEKSNLTRQFLFRNSSIQKSKSVAASEAIKRFRPNFKIRPLNLKVCSDTQTYFSDEFFRGQDVIIGALDNVEGRQYLDRRCIDNCRPLLDSGTFGTKGHVQVILPYLTESYTSQGDPVDDDIPYCTLKSFPSSINHTIQWARDKFDSLFFNKPNMVIKFENARGIWETNLKKVDNGIQLEEEHRNTLVNLIGWVEGALKHKPTDWSMCLMLARLKFEKYFNQRAKQLLFKFPLETKLENGGLFWQFPRRPPTPSDFDLQNPLHYLFVISTAKLLACVWGISPLSMELSKEYVAHVLSSVQVPEFIPNAAKEIETDDSVMPWMVQTERNMLDFKTAIEYLRTAVSQDVLTVKPQEFQKDDEENSHMDFITSASNLRAIMYGIEPAEKDMTRRIAGHIIPAIITTTSAVAGLQTLELLRLVKKSPREMHQNCFLNLALTSFIFAEPAPAPVHTLRNGLRYTLWDKWEVQGHEEFTLNDFIRTIRERYGGTVDTIIQGTKIIYMSFIPTYNTKLDQRMINLIDSPREGLAVELIIDVGDGDEKSGPPIRYFVK